MIIGTHAGYSVTFDENTVRDMGRTASGVRGIRLRENDYVVGAAILDENKEVLVITENGYGKRTKASEYPVKGVIIRFNVDSVSQTGRATLGVRLMRMEDGAKVVTMAVVEPEEVEEEIVEVVETTENETTSETEE